MSVIDTGIKIGVIIIILGLIMYMIPYTKNEIIPFLLSLHISEFFKSLPFAFQLVIGGATIIFIAIFIGAVIELFSIVLKI